MSIECSRSIKGEIKMPDIKAKFEDSPNYLASGLRSDTGFMGEYADVSIKKVENGFIINYGYNSKKIATSFDDMVGILRELLE